MSTLMEPVMYEEAEVQMEEPFEDNNNVDTMFLDVCCQDNKGNSALMLAIEHERVPQARTILHMAVNMGRLATVLAIKNSEGKTALDLAKEKGNVECVKIMRRASKSAGKSRERLRSLPMSRASIDDLDLQFTETNQTENAEQKNAFQYRRPFFMHRHLHREKLTNSLSEREFLMLKRSRSANKSMYSRAFSSSVEKDLSSAHSVEIKDGKDVSERIKALFSRKAESEVTVDRTPQLPQNRPPMENNRDKEYDQEVEEGFTKCGFEPTPQREKESPRSVFKLPPLFNLRRRTASEGRKYLKD